MNLRTFTYIILIIIVAGCKTPHPPTDLTQENLIPKPASVKATAGVFELTDKSAIYVEGDGEEMMRIGQYLADKLNPSTGFNLKVVAAGGSPANGSIYLTLSEDAELGDEGYDLNITESMVTVEANKPAGLFRGIQTIRQLLPDKAELSSVQQGPWHISTGDIRDYPGYGFRGSMLDVSRHFFGVEDVKRYIDLIAFYKMNVLHLHLSDDQGWRIEIKSWPNLATYGGSTQVGGGAGGYYTQEQYKEIVRYAQDRYIMIIPEIDMPGHTNAALASYAELNCNGKATELYTETEVGFSTLCTRNENTYKFVDDVVRELAAITPGPYIHVGGDESHVTKKEDYIYFLNRTQDIVQAHGKQMIGWEEAAQIELKPGSVIQFWANAVHAKEAVEKNAQLIMSPSTRVYIDMQYDSTTRLGLHWAAYIEVDDAYTWDPATLVEGVTKQNILGIEAPLWTETITTMDDIEYMVFPRLVGIAEIAWSPGERSWDEYKVRLGKHAGRMKALDIDYYKSERVPWVVEEEVAATTD